MPGFYGTGRWYYSGPRYTIIKETKSNGDSSDDPTKNPTDGLDNEREFNEPDSPRPEETANASDSESDDESDTENIPDQELNLGDDPENDSPAPTFDIIPGSGDKPLLGYSFYRDPENRENHVREFNSWWDFVTCVADDSLYAWHRTKTHSSHKNSSTWSGTPDFQTAVDMALSRGWPEGREMLHEMLLNIRPRNESFHSLSFDVAGAYPCVPLFNSGDPSCMIIDPGSDLRATNPIIRIDYNHSVSARVLPRDMMLRGAAILSLAQTLESHGFATELRIIANARGNNKIFRYSIVFKGPNESLDLDRAAFAIAHPSSLRRLGLALYEQHAELESDFHIGYGIPMHESNDKESINVVFVPGSKGQETESSAKKAVADAAENLLTQISLAEEHGDD